MVLLLLLLLAMIDSNFGHFTLQTKSPYKSRVQVINSSSFTPRYKMCAAHPGEGELRQWRRKGRGSAGSILVWVREAATSKLASGEEEAPNLPQWKRRGSLLSQEPTIRNRLTRAKRPSARKWKTVGKERGIWGPCILTWMPLKTPWVCILYWAPQRMGVVWLSLSYPVPWLQTQRRENKTQAGSQAPFGNAHLQRKECSLKAPGTIWLVSVFLHWGCFGNRALWKAGLLNPRVTLTLRFSRAHHLGLCLSQTSGGKSQCRISSAANCLPSKRGWQLWISQEWADASSFTLSARNFCRHLMTQFLPDSTN